MKTKRYAFVIPRFGEGVAGGIETLVGTLARELSKRGDDILVLTTCAKDNRTWDNFYPAGDAVEFGVRVKRFPVDARNLETWVPLQIRIGEGKPSSIDEQLTWMQESVNSAALYDFIRSQGRSFDLLFFAPYLFGTTFWGSLIHPSRSVLIPCLHDESYAYLEITGSMFRQVRGCLFNAAPEMELARSLYGAIPGGVVGMGFEEGESVSREPYFKDSFPYLLYLGRKETGKNAHVLVDYFCDAKNRGIVPAGIRLVIAGGGSFTDLHRPAALERHDIVDVQHVSEDEKQRLLHHAIALCQPSTNESFSIVIMEAWLAGTPVIVHGECAVTRHHVVESGGGLFFSNSDDLGGVIRTLTSNAKLARQLVDNGRRYVHSAWSWEAVLRRFDSVTAHLQVLPGVISGPIRL